jgi:hypothetical protein
MASPYCVRPDAFTMRLRIQPAVGSGDEFVASLAV